MFGRADEGVAREWGSLSVAELPKVAVFASLEVTCLAEWSLRREYLADYFVQFLLELRFI